METRGHGAEGSLPEEGNNAHRPVGKREQQMGKWTARPPLEVKWFSTTTNLVGSVLTGTNGHREASWRPLNPEVSRSLEESRVKAGPAQEAQRSLGAKELACLTVGGKVAIEGNVPIPGGDQKPRRDGGLRP